MRSPGRMENLRRAVPADFDVFGVRYLADFSLRGPEELTLAEKLVGVTTETPGYFKQLEALVSKRVVDAASPELHEAVPEQRLYVIFFGLKEYKTVDNFIANEMVERSMAFLNHFERRLRSFKVSVKMTSQGFAIRNNGTIDDNTYCFVEVQVRMGMIYLVTAEIMASHMIKDGSTTPETCVLKCHDVLGSDASIQHMFGGNRWSTRQGVKILGIAMDDFPCNKKLGKCVSFIANVFLAKINLIREKLRASRRARLAMRPCRCNTMAAGE